MNLQKLVKPVLLALFISLSLPAFSNTLVPGTEMSAVPAENPNKTTDPLLRLQQIKNMNMENLSRAEKRDLRKEIKGIRKALKEQKNGIYLSLGAIVIIVVVLLLLL